LNAADSTARKNKRNTKVESPLSLNKQTSCFPATFSTGLYIIYSSQDAPFGAGAKAAHTIGKFFLFVRSMQYLVIEF